MLSSRNIDTFVKTVKGAAYTDITGGILQAAEFLYETGAGRKVVLVFSDMEEELAEGYVRDIPLQLQGIEIVALNVTKLRDRIRANEEAIVELNTTVNKLRDRIKANEEAMVRIDNTLNRCRDRSKALEDSDRAQNQRIKALEDATGVATPASE